MIPRKYYWLFAMVGAQGLLMVVSLVREIQESAGIFLFFFGILLTAMVVIDLLKRRRKDPRWFDSQYYHYVVLIFAYILLIHLLLLLTGNRAWDWHHLYVAVYSIFLILLGNLTPRLPFGSLMGLWIPGLFRSEERWCRAHRIAGFIYVAFGLLFLSLILLDFRIRNQVRLIFFYILLPLVVSNILPLLWEKMKQSPSAGGR